MIDTDFDPYDNEPRGRVHPGLLALALCGYLAAVVAILGAIVWWLG